MRWEASSTWPFLPATRCLCTDCDSTLLDKAQGLLGHLRDFALRDAEVVGDEARRISGQPARDRNLLEHRAVEQREELQRLAADVLHVMSEALLREHHHAGPV